MSWGAINEWPTWAGYNRLIAQEQHTTLEAILRRIMRQETRHIGFYATEARRRLATSERAQRVTRFALKHFWTPVGSAVMPFGETAFLLDYLLGAGPGCTGTETPVDPARSRRARLRRFSSKGGHGLDVRPSPSCERTARIPKVR